jgi:hypothetical protein
MRSTPLSLCVRRTSDVETSRDLDRNVSHRQTTLCVDSIEIHTKSLDFSLSATICALSQFHKQTYSFNERADRRSISAPFDQVAFSATRDKPLIHIWLSLVNPDHIRSLATVTLTAWAGPPRFTPLSQGSEHHGALLTPRYLVERRINGFATDTHRGVIWEHAWKYACNLFSKVVLPKKLLNLRPQIASSQANGFAASGTIQCGTVMGKNKTVTSCPIRSTSTSELGLEITPIFKRQLLTKRTKASSQTASNCPNGAPSLKAQLNQSPFFTINSKRPVCTA